MLTSVIRNHMHQMYLVARFACRALYIVVPERWPLALAEILWITKSLRRPEPDGTAQSQIALVVKPSCKSAGKQYRGLSFAAERCCETIVLCL